MSRKRTKQAKTNLLDEAGALPKEKKGEFSDEQILFQSLKKPEQFECIVDRYQDLFRNKVRSILGNREEIDDIVQETFVKIYLNAGRFEVRTGASFKSWAYKILINTTFTHYQKFKKIEGATANIEKEFYEALPDESFEHRLELNDFVASILSRMPSELAKVLRLHFIQGMPQKEIAALEKVSISAIKTRVHRAKKKFRNLRDEIE